MLDIKVLNEDQKTVEITVLSAKSINSALILNLDEKLNDTTKIEVVNKVLSIVDDEKLLTVFKNAVEKQSKRNELILSEYEEIKDDIFKKVEKTTFEKLNDEINEKLMLLEINGKTKKVYNCFDFWYTHNDQKLKKMIANYNTLKTYKKLYEQQKK